VFKLINVEFNFIPQAERNKLQCWFAGSLQGMLLHGIMTPIHRSFNPVLTVSTTGFDSSWLPASLAFVDLRDGRPVCVIRFLLSIDVGSLIDFVSVSSISTRSETSPRSPTISSYSSTIMSVSSVVLSIFTSTGGPVFLSDNWMNCKSVAI